MKKLWQKNYDLDKQIEKYCSGKNVVLDNVLAKYDVLGTMAHAKMLGKIEILTDVELSKTLVVLGKILKLIDSGDFEVKLGEEDIHTKVENYLVEVLGDTGKKIHTARSRNDQINLDLKLYTKDQLIKVVESTGFLIKAFNNLAKKYEFVAMPGYTHVQKAMPSSLGMWAGSFAESLLDDLEIVKGAFENNDQSPLGSGAAYGVSLKIDREMTADLLGFKKVQNNSLYSQVSRCKTQALVLHAMSQIMLTLSRFAGDMLLFTTSEFDFLKVPREFCTGSSIMPQKNNLDIMEILRAQSQLVLQYSQSSASILSGLPSGYNADFGETKSSFIAGIESTIDSVRICELLVKNLQPNIQKLELAFTRELYATHAAYELVKGGVAFRDAYKQVALSLESIPDYDKNEILKASSHTGGTGNLNLELINKKLKLEYSWWNKKSKIFYEAIDNLKSSITPTPRLFSHLQLQS